MSYKLKNDPLMNGYKIILENDKAKFCPFQPPLLIPGQLQGQTEIQYKLCGTWCALFSVDDDYFICG